jgi:hypothetical protein
MPIALDDAALPRLVRSARGKRGRRRPRKLTVREHEPGDEQVGT